MVKYPYPIDSALDLITLLFIVTLLLLSILSLGFIFHLCFKSRTAHHLQHFNSLWTVRLLLVIFVIFWSFNELLRLPSFRRTYLYGRYPFLSTFFKVEGFEEEDKFCKIFFLFSPIDKMFLPLPAVFTRSSMVKAVESGKMVAFCEYPLLSTVIFGVFAATYFMWFLFSLWKVLSLVINKGLRMRIYALAVTVLVPLPVQVILLGLSVMWNPDKPAFAAISFVVFLITFVSFAVGQGILVLKPIADSLAAGGESCRWNPQVEVVKGRNNEGKDENESVV
ncbi:uncharacterized protein LOC126802122 [Argentina anserina]|uniref:uncharacterized protein LOC126802122 n=1 Tax=Argentina anserina TaxID=57926 RepID=UPI00217631ED|nr:uncharacterized protein LOC126802122 [Potentilla anserina]